MLYIPKLIFKKKYFFSLMYIRISEKSVNFDDRKIKRSDFYKNKNFIKSIILMLIKH